MLSGQGPVLVHGIDYGNIALCEPKGTKCGCRCPSELWQAWGFSRAYLPSFGRCKLWVFGFLFMMENSCHRQMWDSIPPPNLTQPPLPCSIISAAGQRSG